MNNPTETLDAIEHALRFYTTLVPSRDIVADTEPCCGPMDGAEFGNRARNGLTHLATLKQQVADLVAMTTNQPTDEKLDDLVEWIRQYVEANKDQCRGGTGMAEMDAREIREAVRSRIKQRILSMFTVHLAADGGQGACQP